MPHLTDNRVANAITRHLQSRWRRGSAGFMAFNCPMCIERGETQDRRHRGGVLIEGSCVGVFCFNCGFRTKYTMGKPLGGNVQQFLERIGVPRIEVKRISHWALSLAKSGQAASAAPPSSPASPPPPAPEAALPPQAQRLQEWVDDGCDDPGFIDAARYLLSRGDAVARATDYYWTPCTDDDLNRRLIIPCLLGARIVGWTARAAGPDGLRPKYIKKWPPDFLFNADALLAEDRNCVIVTEGVLDALALDAVGTGGARLNAKQVAWINSSPKRKIVLPDRDRAGDRLVDVAIENGWSVAFPGVGRSTWWEPDVKDAAEASKRYGRLWTLRSVIATATENQAQIKTFLGLSHK